MCFCPIISACFGAFTIRISYLLQRCLQRASHLFALGLTWTQTKGLKRYLMHLQRNLTQLVSYKHLKFGKFRFRLGNRPEWLQDRFWFDGAGSLSLFKFFRRRVFNQRRWSLVLARRWWSIQIRNEDAAFVCADEQTARMQRNGCSWFAENSAGASARNRRICRLYYLDRQYLAVPASAPHSYQQSRLALDWCVQTESTQIAATNLLSTVPIRFFGLVLFAKFETSKLA